MADYPAIIVDENGDQTAGNTISFTDPDNQPGLVANPPFHAAETGSTAIMVDSPDGDPVIAFDADAGKIVASYDIDNSGNLITANNLTAASLLTAGEALLGGDPSSPVGFYGTGGVAQPVVPLTTPAVQDVVDALVLLGLVSQSD